jgi:uncharacterized protein (DUF2147 family)
MPLAFAVLSLSATAAFASPAGNWRVEDNSADVRIAACGKGTYCGYAKSGETILDHMKASGPNAWSGTIRDLRSGSLYDGTISLISDQALKVRGCVQGGGMCGDQTWSRTGK